MKNLQDALDIRTPGTFTKATQAAVKDWQNDHGVSVTGVVHGRMRFLLAV